MVSHVAPLVKKTVLIKVRQVKTAALVDTGASVSCVSMNYLKKVGFSSDHLHESDLQEIVGVGGEIHKVLGAITLNICIGNPTRS